MGKATYIKSLGWKGDARLFKVSPPMKYRDIGDDSYKETDFVIVSAVVAMFSGPETYIFPANKDGSAINYLELEGSFRGGLDHRAALSGAGYETTGEAVT